MQEAGKGPVPVRGGASPEHAHQPAELHAGTLMQPTVCFTVLLQQGNGAAESAAWSLCTGIQGRLLVCMICLFAHKGGHQHQG